MPYNLQLVNSAFSSFASLKLALVIQLLTKMSLPNLIVRQAHFVLSFVRVYYKHDRLPVQSIYYQIKA